MQERDGGADPAELARTLTELAEKSRAWRSSSWRSRPRATVSRSPIPGVVGDAFVKLSQAMLADPAS